MPEKTTREEAHELSAPTGATVYHAVRKEGEDELNRSTAALALVVDDVEDHGKAARVGRVDEPPEIVGRAVVVRRREQIDAVVTPVARAGSFGHRHQLDRGDAERREVVEPRFDTGERARRRERADVQLVDDEVVARHAAPVVVGPLERRGIDEHRRPVRAFGLKPRRGRNVRRPAGEAAVGQRAERAGRRRVRAHQHDVDARCIRRPHGELRAAVGRHGAERRRPGSDSFCRRNHEAWRARSVPARRAFRATACSV
jgi:hypothetical protein